MNYYVKNYYYLLYYYPKKKLYLIIITNNHNFFLNKKLKNKGFPKCIKKTDYAKFIMAMEMKWLN